jgi:hypothetical protein
MRGNDEIRMTNHDAEGFRGNRGSFKDVRRVGQIGVNPGKSKLIQPNLGDRGAKRRKTRRGGAATKRHLKRKDAKTQRAETDSGDFLERRSSPVLVAKKATRKAMNLKVNTARTERINEERRKSSGGGFPFLLSCSRARLSHFPLLPENSQQAPSWSGDPSKSNRIYESGWEVWRQVCGPAVAGETNRRAEAGKR